MQNIGETVTILYSRFVLLDLFGKIVPGALLLLIEVASLTSWAHVKAFLTGMPWWLWLFVFGASWVATFAVQAFGEALDILRDLPANYTRDQWYQKVKQFEKCSSDREKQQAERLLVIKEACGNSCVVLGLCLLFLGFRVMGNVSTLTTAFCFETLPGIIVAIGAVAFLRASHRNHVDRHRQYVESIIRVEGVGSSMPNGDVA